MHWYYATGKEPKPDEPPDDPYKPWVSHWSAGQLVGTVDLQEDMIPPFQPPPGSNWIGQWVQGPWEYSQAKDGSQWVTEDVQWYHSRRRRIWFNVLVT